MAYFKAFLVFMVGVVLAALFASWVADPPVSTLISFALGLPVGWITAAYLEFQLEKRDIKEIQKRWPDLETYWS